MTDDTTIRDDAAVLAKVREHFAAKPNSSGFVMRNRNGNLIFRCRTPLRRRMTVFAVTEDQRRINRRDARESRGVWQGTVVMTNRQLRESFGREADV